MNIWSWAKTHLAALTAAQYERVDTYDLLLTGGNELVNARAVVTVRDWTEHGRRNQSCTVAVSWLDESLEATSHSVYHAFQHVRLELEAFGLIPDCYGSSSDVQVSGMLCDMGDGSVAYRIALAQQGKTPPMVNIFDREPGLQLGTVSDQKAYHRRMWEPTAG